MSGAMLGFAAGRDFLTRNEVAEIPSVFPHVDVRAFALGEVSSVSEGAVAHEGQPFEPNRAKADRHRPSAG